jgi:hypothetical protein
VKRTKQVTAAAAKVTRKRRGKRKGKAGGEPQAKIARRSSMRSEVGVEGQGASAWRAPEAPCCIIVVVDAKLVLNGMGPCQ